MLESIKLLNTETRYHGLDLPCNTALLLSYTMMDRTELVDIMGWEGRVTDDDSCLPLHGCDPDPETAQPCLQLSQKPFDLQALWKPCECSLVLLCFLVYIIYYLLL